ncbi:HAD family phosphatase [Tautonia sp. JC769]|uniref:HAD family hydrolase n=1 Tax=Tautonia sp. JC769 TaxID=3232135 RepID=UPI003457AE68
MNLPAIIFDFGNVVGFFDYVRACEAIALPRGLDGPALLRNARERGLNELVARLEIGQLPAEAFVSSCCSLLELDALTPDEFRDAWSDIFWPNESLVPLIRRLSDAGHPLILGSNTNGLHASRFRGQFADTLAAFDRLILSYEIGHLKPSMGFYRACVEAAGADPAHCIFIDDLPENVEGARRAGLHGLCYRDTPTLEADLLRLGVAAAARES